VDNSAWRGFVRTLEAEQIPKTIARQEDLKRTTLGHIKHFFEESQMLAVLPERFSRLTAPNTERRLAGPCWLTRDRGWPSVLTIRLAAVVNVRTAEVTELDP
jgi:hypothetical protein